MYLFLMNGLKINVIITKYVDLSFPTLNFNTPGAMTLEMRVVTLLNIAPFSLKKAT